MMTCVAGSTTGLKQNKLKVTISILMTKHEIIERYFKTIEKTFLSRGSMHGV